MFKYLYDALSYLWSWRWPTTEGAITAIDTEWIRNDRLRLAVVYQFSIGDDGPYCGEAFWVPLFWIGQAKTISKARRALRRGQRVEVRYRRDDPEVNTLNGGIRRLLSDAGM